MKPLDRSWPAARRVASPSYTVFACVAALLCGGCSALGGGGDAARDGDASAFDGTDGSDPDATPLDDADAGPVTPVAFFQLPRSGPNAFMLPWPSDLTLTSRGFVDFRYVPNPVNNPMLSRYATLLQDRIAGFSTIAATYFRFSVAVDAATLPASLADSLRPESTVQIVDVDPMSPEVGRRHPAQYYLRVRSGRYWSPNTLAVAPAFGHPLHGRRLYAIVVTRGVRPEGGGAAFQRDADLDAVLSATGGDAMVAGARAAYGPAVNEVERSGVPRDRILSLAVFRTQDPVGEFFRAADYVRNSFDPPGIVDITAATPGAEYQTFTGHYGPNPVLQAGAAPYTDPGSGGWEFAASGEPIVQRRENIRFALTVPVAEPPANGYPVAIYAHGTGGTARSFINDGTALSLANQGIAVLGFDQLFNGERAVGAITPQAAEAQFFNFDNPVAGRNNNRQAGIDLVQAGRLVSRMRITAMVSGRMTEIRFDPERIMFFGHSQGGLNGPLWLAADDTANAGVLSGAGGTILISIIQKTQPVNIPIVLGTGLGIASSSDEMVALHPALTLIQTTIDCEDPVNFARYLIVEPRMGQRPAHIFQTLGLIDHYTPPDAIASLATAAGLQLATPVLQAYGFYDSLGGAAAAALPLQGNLAGGAATGVWQQYRAATGRDGHFVVFDVPAARMRAARFLGGYVAGATGTATPAVVP